METRPKKENRWRHHRQMDKYIIHLLMRYQDGDCAHCGFGLDLFQIHHKRYGEDITIDDLELIHGDCHNEKHGRKGISGCERSTRLWKDGHLRGTEGF